MGFLNSDLPEPINFPDNKYLEDCIVLGYEYFKANILSQDIRPKLFGKNLYVDAKSKINNIHAIFWHLAGLEEQVTKDLNILPCQNETCSHNCMTNCEHHLKKVNEQNGKVKIPCLYRISRLNWINEIINLANQNNSNVSILTEPKRTKRGTIKRTILRYQYFNIDYVIILEERRTDFYFVTAYPVFFSQDRKKFDRLEQKKTEQRHAPSDSPSTTW